VSGFPGAEEVPSSDILELPCDILIPAALGQQIHALNAAKIKAKIIVEGANGPTEPEGEKILLDDGKVIIPDILANAGGVVVSYFEWVQNRQKLFWEEGTVNQNLHRIIKKAFYEVYSIAREKKIDLRRAAYVLAVDRVAEATRFRGIYP
jgi:glutamate dehydrogenase (NAD(P)+)